MIRFMAPLRLLVDALRQGYDMVQSWPPAGLASRGWRMRTVRLIAKIVLAAGLATAALGVGLRGYMNSRAQNRLLPGEAADIAKLRSPLPQPGFIACPPGYCVAGEAAASPIFAVSWTHLREAWRRMIAAEPRVVEVADDEQHRRSAYIAHTAVLGFPDIVTAEFVALGEDRSSIALYSRSRYGRSDFGTNRRRVERWLSRLKVTLQGPIANAAAADRGKPGSQSHGPRRPVSGTEPR
jgi:uncharacterized protein (DUF1499 family)